MADDCLLNHFLAHKAFHHVMTLYSHVANRSNLLNSACLQLFDLIIKTPITKLVTIMEEEYSEMLSPALQQRVHSNYS